MVASHLLGQGLGPPLIADLLGDSVTTDSGALRIFHALQREAAHEQRVVEAERRSAAAAAANLEPTGMADISRFAQAREPYSPAWTGSGGRVQQPPRRLEWARLQQLRAASASCHSVAGQHSDVVGVLLGH